MDTTIPSSPEGEIRLRDGRRLAYAEYGDPQGKPIFFFHGTPGSRLFHHPDNSFAASAGARIIAVDRPGFGRSDFKPGRTLLDWPNDVVQLADALNIGRFAVMGHSGGGPYAAACASAIPDRLTAAGLVSSISPLDTPEITKGMHGMGHTFFSLERHLPPLARLSCRLMCTAWRSNPDLYFKAQLNGLYGSREAQDMLPVMKEMLTADLLEAIRAGTQGITWDLEILARPWGFQLHVVATDVFLWHGEDDTQAPLAMGKRLAGAFPHCRATFYPGEGHWAIYSHWQEILTTLARAEATIRVGPQPSRMAATGEVGSISVAAVAPAGADSDEKATDSVQGLQPARETPEITPAEKTQGIATGESPAGTSREPEPVHGTPKPASKKTGQRRSAPKTEVPAGAAVEPEPAHGPRATSKKANGRRPAAVAASQTEVSVQPRPAPGRANAAAGKPGKRAAAAAATAEHRPQKGSAKATAKKAARLKSAVEPTSAVVLEEPVPRPEEPEPVSAKSSSRRRAAKEAVLV